MELKRIIHRYWISIAVIAGILYLSFAPPSTFKRIPTFEHEDKLVHLIMYLGLTAVLIFDYKRKTNRTNNSVFRFVLICLFFPAFFGGLIEVFQPLLSSQRSGSWTDWLADIIGVLLGWLLMKLILKKMTLQSLNEGLNIFCKNIKKSRD